MKAFKKAALVAAAMGAVALFGCNDKREPRIENDARGAVNEAREDTREMVDDTREGADEVRDDVKGTEGLGGAGREGEIGDGKIGNEEGVINDGEGPFEQNKEPLNGNGVLEGGDGVDNGQ